MGVNGTRKPTVEPKCSNVIWMGKYLDFQVCGRTPWFLTEVISQLKTCNSLEKILVLY